MASEIFSKRHLSSIFFSQDTYWCQAEQLLWPWNKTQNRRDKGNDRSDWERERYQDESYAQTEEQAM